jgi:AraC-like DNA-binding protein
MSYYRYSEDLAEPRPIFCGAWVASPGTWYHPHLAPQHSLFWVLDGSATVESEGRSYEILPNGIYCAPAGIDYVVRWDTHRATRWGWVNVDLTDAPELPRQRPVRSDDILIPLLNHMVALSTDRPAGWGETIRIVYECALRIYASEYSSTHIAHDGAYSELIVRMIAAVQRRWLGPSMTTLSLPDLAAELGVTPRHLCRVFEKEIGVGPMTALRTARILQAARLLTDTGRPIQEIASRTGFANHYHFSSAFKATVGVPPGEYRFHPPAQTTVPPRVQQLADYFTVPA